MQCCGGGGTVLIFSLHGCRKVNYLGLLLLDTVFLENCRTESWGCRGTVVIIL